MSAPLLSGVLNRFANPPVPYIGRGYNLPVIGRRSTTAHLDAMGSVGTLFAIVNRLSNAVSQVEWNLYRTPGPRAATDAPPVQVRSHAALDLWNKPNPWMTRQEFVETFQQHQELTGEAFWVANRQMTIPLEIWPVRPDRMAPVPSATDFLTGYVYATPGGERVPLANEDVVFLRMPNPLDPYRGMGPVQTILHDLDSSRYASEWNANFFKNSATPGGVIESEGTMGDDEFERFQARWRASHQGVANAHRVAILEAGMKWVDRRYTNREMEFNAGREMIREIIMEAYGISKTMLGRSEDVNRATAEAAEYVFGKYLMVPRLERIKGALNNDFLPMFGVTGQGVYFDYCNPVPEDEEQERAEMAAAAQAAATLVDAGYEPEDVLLTVGLPPMRYVGKGVTGGAPQVDAPAVGPAA